jgi:predicted O-methyltransferase YrrM
MNDHKGQLLIPVEYWDGRDSLELEYPWIVPEAIQTLHYFVKPHHEVLEYGSGGSTLFFARRAKHVTSIENSPEWATQVMAAADRKGLSNITMHVAPMTQDCPDLTGRLFDVALIDCCEIDRRVALKVALGLMRPGSIVVIDNYDAVYCLGIDEILARYTNKHDFDDLHWWPAGKGTRVVYT